MLITSWERAAAVHRELHNRPDEHVERETFWAATRRVEVGARLAGDFAGLAALYLIQVDVARRTRVAR